MTEREIEMMIENYRERENAARNALLQERLSYEKTLEEEIKELVSIASLLAPACFQEQKSAPRTPAGSLPAHLFARKFEGIFV